MIQYWLGTKEYCPAAIVVNDKKPVKVIRFYKAFKNNKHGKSSLLNEKVDELLSAL